MAAAWCGSREPVGIGIPPQVARAGAAWVDGRSASALLDDKEAFLQGFLNEMIDDGVESASGCRVVVGVGHVWSELSAEHLPGFFRAVRVAPVAELASVIIGIVLNILWHRTDCGASVGITLPAHQEDFARRKGVAGLQRAADNAVTLLELVACNDQPFVFVREERLAGNQGSVAVRPSAKEDLRAIPKGKRRVVAAQCLPPDVGGLSARQEVAQLAARQGSRRHPVLLDALRVGGILVEVEAVSDDRGTAVAHHVALVAVDAREAARVVAILHERAAVVAQPTCYRGRFA